MHTDIDIINYASKYATKLKAKVFGHDQMKFNEVELKPGKPEKQHIAITTVRKTSCYLWQIILKSRSGGGGYCHIWAI